MANITDDAQFHNDASKSRYGDLYQYIIALEHCLNAPAGGVIYIEQRGDVANESISVEIKHHDSKKHTIAEKHIDFWKTLKNWVVNRDVIAGYSELILLTTSNITLNSKLHNWNEISAPQKLNIIKEIKNDVLTNNTNKTIQPFIKYIFEFLPNGHNDTHLLSILDRFKIISNQPRILEKIADIQKLNQFKFIPFKNRTPFIQELLSYIIFRCVVEDLSQSVSSELKASESWLVRIDAFNAFAEAKIKHYVKDSTPIITTYRNHTSDVSKYSQYVFVKEIEKINYNTEIQEAVNNFHRAFLTTLDMSNDDPLFVMAVEGLQEVILDDLVLLKKTILLENECSDKKQAERNAKICFARAMGFDIRKIQGYELDHTFFQRGTIHQVVDLESFNWHIELE
ncbi:hypothetical protein [Hymenobacter chitinivorans]|uniref:DUF4297 domain-containing protein n=1 Tax=Hymenobacter chitinivorans DSM 11115 TaxID=1121954 RepID=A0A2M9ASY5_9BACT|nr:hypothetical protein [Hymenobacter chitinivorans]PJJ48810.1 hypothetical protein CLV45_4522 [Hymenobacter chitinivorans DSM 11115]